VHPREEMKALVFGGEEQSEALVAVQLNKNVEILWNEAEQNKMKERIRKTQVNEEGKEGGSKPDRSACAY
jgi:hypothetical protein